MNGIPIFYTKHQAIQSLMHPSKDRHIMLLGQNSTDLGSPINVMKFHHPIAILGDSSEDSTLSIMQLACRCATSNARNFKAINVYDGKSRSWIVEPTIETMALERYGDPYYEQRSLLVLAIRNSLQFF